MNPPDSAPSVSNALQHSVSAGLRVCRDMGRVIRSAASMVPEAAVEKRGVVRTLCLAVEQVARAGIRAARGFEERNVVVWRLVPRVGSVVSRIIAGATWIAVALLSIVVSAMIACDVLLNTAAEWRLLHPRLR